MSVDSVVDTKEAQLLTRLIETLLRDMFVAREGRKNRLTAIQSVAKAKAKAKAKEDSQKSL
jgi:hypothetical protein